MNRLKCCNKEQLKNTDSHVSCESDNISETVPHGDVVTTDHR